MHREIKFRGLRTDGKGWVYGIPLKTKFSCDYIITEIRMESIDFIFSKLTVNKLGGAISVIPESVGQFTGLKDRNGKEIYEGDRTKDGIVIYENGCFILFLTDKYEPFNDMKQRLWFTHSNQEVIGNIHEQK